MTQSLVVPSTGEVPEAFQVIEREKGSITMFEQPFQYRIDMRGALKKTQFEANGFPVGDTFSFVPLNWIIQKQIRPSDQYQEPTDFLVMVCLNKDDIVSNFTLNSTNMKDFLAKVNYLKATGVTPSSFRYTITPNKVKNKAGLEFYVFEWQLEPVGEEYFNKVIAFVQQSPEILNAIRLLPNID